MFKHFSVLLLLIINPPCSISSIQWTEHQIHYWISTIKTEFNSLFLCNSSATPEEKSVRISKTWMQISLRSQMCAAGDLGLGCVLTWTSCTATMWAWCQQRTEWSLDCIWLSQNCLPCARRGWQPKCPLKPTDLYMYIFTNHWYYSRFLWFKSSTSWKKQNTCFIFTSRPDNSLWERKTCSCFKQSAFGISQHFGFKSHSIISLCVFCSLSWTLFLEKNNTEKDLRRKICNTDVCGIRPVGPS